MANTPISRARPATSTGRRTPRATVGHHGLIALEADASLVDLTHGPNTGWCSTGGVQPAAPTYPDALVGFGAICPLAGDAPAPYAADAYRRNGFRVGYSGDGGNACPMDPSQPFPNLDNMNDFIAAYYAGGGSTSADRVHQGELSAPAVGNLFGYAGYVWDPALSSATGAAAGVGSEPYTDPVLASAYYHVRHRVYDAANGRWTRRDPLGYVDGTNLLAYVKSSPIQSVDSSGTDTLTLYCRPLDIPGLGKLARHCWVKCCTAPDKCTNFSLLNGPPAGTAKIVINDPRDDPKKPGVKKHGEKNGQSLCACMAERHASMKGGGFPYNALSCNSNWYATSLWRCCTGENAPAPGEAVGSNSCCGRSGVPALRCKRDGGGKWPGSDGPPIMCWDIDPISSRSCYSRGS